MDPALSVASDSECGSGSLSCGVLWCVCMQGGGSAQNVQLRNANSKLCLQVEPKSATGSQLNQELCDFQQTTGTQLFRFTGDTSLAGRDQQA